MKTKDTLLAQVSRLVSRDQSCTFFECVLAKKVRTDPANQLVAQVARLAACIADRIPHSALRTPYSAILLRLAGLEPCAMQLHLIPVRATPTESRRYGTARPSNRIAPSVWSA